MKTLLALTFTLLNYSCFSQTQQRNDTLYNLTLSYRPATIMILRDTNSLTSSFVRYSQRITYTDIKPGHYKIQVSGQGQPTVIKDSIVVLSGQTLVLRIMAEGQCLYDHPADYIPICPKNHKGNIIPIVYGLLIKRGDTFIKDRMDMKVKYGGCVTTGCDPQFYCKEHDIEF